jgi:hypothetical protein
MNYSNSALRLQPRRSAPPRRTKETTILSLEIDQRGTHLRLRKASTLARRTRRPLATAFLGLAAAASAQIVIQPVTEAESKDTKIYNTTPTMNFSSNLNVTSLSTGAHFLGLVQFDLALNPYTAAEITSASLILYATAIGASGLENPLGGEVALRAILNPWKETAADPTVGPLATYDAFFGTTPTLGLGPVVATQTVSSGGVFVSWDITHTVKAWVDGSLANNGLLFGLVTDGGDIGFADVDSAGPAFAPALQIVPEPAGAALLGTALLPLVLRRRRA